MKKNHKKKSKFKWIKMEDVLAENSDLFSTSGSCSDFDSLSAAEPDDDYNIICTFF